MKLFNESVKLFNASIKLFINRFSPSANFCTLSALDSTLKFSIAPQVQYFLLVPSSRRRQLNSWQHRAPLLGEGCITPFLV
jgi:hypothetical protein